MHVPVIVEAVRTPFGRQAGYYRETRPDNLLAHAMSGLVKRSGVDPTALDDVITGCVFQAQEQGANISRLGSLLAGIPTTVPAVSVNRWCGSSQQALIFAAQAVAAGDANYVLAAGVESLTRVPMFSDVGGLERLNPQLAEHYELVHQGESGERIAEQWGISRQAADQFGMESQRRAAAAAGAAWHREILPTPALDRDGNQITATRDEGIRPSSDPAKVAALQAAFRPDGNGIITAANSSQIADGASALLMANEEIALGDGLRSKARVIARAFVGSDPTLSLTGVIPATKKVLARAGIAIDDLDWIEINEAFATVVLAWAQEISPDMSKVNPWGGAIAHGHPLGATGVGLMAKMLAGLEQTGGTLGLLTICIGHGQATATIVERV